MFAVPQGKREHPSQTLDQLFAVAKGSAVVHVLEAASGKEVKQIRVPGEPLQSLACHPRKGQLLYGANLNDEVYAIDTEKETATKTKASMPI